MSNFNELSNQNLSGFIPALVIDYLLEKLRKKESRKLPEKQTFDSVVMFADISGFTNLAEKLTKRGHEGTELLAFTLNRYMELLVKAIGRSGGDIFKFAGDAIIIVWPPPSDKSHLVILCRQAIQSALDIQSKLTDFKIIDEVKLSVKIGFGVGQVTIAHVGGVFQRAEYLPAGSPLTQAFECEHLAPGGGVVIVSKQVWEKCFDYFEFEDVKGHHEGENSPFYFVKKVKKSVKMKADALLMKNNIKPSDIEAIRGSLKSYIPAAVVPFIELDQEKWSAELRRLTVLFVNLGIDLKDAQSQEGLERIQIVIETVQRNVYSNQGSLNKFLMDDKGSTLIILFGLPPMAHQDDPVRGVLTAHVLVKALRKINCSCSVGITTGMVFAGVVGTSGSRREYSVLGDTVNLSARFMQAACQEKEKKILVDEITRREAEHKLNFRFVKKSAVKGKTGEIPFYEPVFDELEKNDDLLKKIKVHHIKALNSNETGHFLSGKVYETEIKKSFEMMEKFLSRPQKNCLLMITGGYGVGKSAFLRIFLEKMAKRIENDKWKHNEKTQVIISTLNCVEKTKKLNGLRGIFQEIFRLIAQRWNIYNENLLIKLLENDKDRDMLTNMELVADILNLKLIGEQFSRPSAKKKSEEFENTMIKRILMKILAEFLEDEQIQEKSDDITDNDSESVAMRSNTNFSHPKLNKENLVAPLIIVLDDMQDYDPMSWGLLKKMLKTFKRLFVIISVRTEGLEFQIPKKASNTTSDNKNENMSSTSIQRTPSEVKKKLRWEQYNSQPDEYVDSMMFELEESCENCHYYRVDLEGLTETHELEGFIFKNFSVKNVEYFDKSDRKPDKFYRFLSDKTQGNPLDLMYLLNNLLESDYLFLDETNFKLLIKSNLEKCIDLEEFLTIPAPLSRFKINTPILDHLPCRTKLMLKAACVIGDCFDLQMLWKVIPFKETLTKERLLKILGELEKQEFLEILDQSSNNITYRFTSPFMREIIYQSMIYNHRRNFHRYVAEGIQSVQLPSDNSEKIETDKLIYHWSLAEDKNPFLFTGTQGSADFSNKAKRSIIVKKISSLISKNPNNPFAVLKKGVLDKKSDRGYTWAKRFCLMNSKEFKYFYSEEGAKNDNQEALGTFALKNIYSIMPITEKEAKGKLFAFVIYVGSWLKKDKEMGIREFYFSAVDNDELEQWTTYIEFTKAKAIYESFVNTFGKISFPLGNANEHFENFDLDIDINTRKNQGSLSRLTLITQHNDMNSALQNPSTYKSLSRKTTSIGKGLKRNTQATNYAIETQNEVNAYTSAENNKKLKERLICLFNNTSMLFWSHILEGANQYKLKDSDPLRQPDGHNFGRTSHLMRTNNLLVNVEKSLMEDPVEKQQRFTVLMNKMITKSSLSSNGRQSGGGILNESMEELNAEFNKSSNDSNDDNLLGKKQTIKGGDREKLEKIDEVSEARDSLISRTESLHMNRRGTGYFDPLTLQKATNMNSVKKISENEIEEKSKNNNLIIAVPEEKNDLRKNSCAMVEIQEEKLEEIEEEEKTNNVIIVEESENMENEEKIKLLLLGKEQFEKEKKKDKEIEKKKYKDKEKEKENEKEKSQKSQKSQNSLEILQKDIRSFEEFDSFKKTTTNNFDMSLNSNPISEKDRSNINLFSEEKSKEKSFRSKKQETIDPEMIKYVSRGENIGANEEISLKSEKGNNKPKVIQRMMEKEKKNEVADVKRWTTVMDNKNGGDPQNLNYKSVINFYSKTNHNKYHSFN